MPCCNPYSYYNEPVRTKKSSKDAARGELVKLGKQYNELKEQADKLTQLLCYACGTLQHMDMMRLCDKRLRDWFTEHDGWDFNRTLATMKKKFGRKGAITEKAALEWFIKQAEDVHPLSGYHTGDYWNRIWAAFSDWKANDTKRRTRIAELEKELAELKAQL